MLLRSKLNMLLWKDFQKRKGESNRPVEGFCLWLNWRWLFPEEGLYISHFSVYVQSHPCVTVASNPSWFPYKNPDFKLNKGLLSPLACSPLSCVCCHWSGGQEDHLQLGCNVATLNPSYSYFRTHTSIILNIFFNFSRQFCGIDRTQCTKVQVLHEGDLI